MYSDGAIQSSHQWSQVYPEGVSDPISFLTITGFYRFLTGNKGIRPCWCWDFSFGGCFSYIVWKVNCIVQVVFLCSWKPMVTTTDKFKWVLNARGHIHVCVLRMVQLNKRKKNGTQFKVFLGFLLHFICFTGCSAPSPFINIGVDEADCTINQLNFREVATGMAHLKTSLLGLCLQTHHRSTVAFVLF